MGQEVEYNGNMGKQRITSEEKRAIERSRYDDYNDARRAAEAHRQVDNIFLRSVLQLFKQI